MKGWGGASERETGLISDIGWEAVIALRQKRDGHRSMRTLSALLLLGACQHNNASVGPSHDELVAAMKSNLEVAGPLLASVSELRSISCREFDEEPTEYSCGFEAKQPTGDWQNISAIVALDGDGWILLDVELETGAQTSH